MELWNLCFGGVKKLILRDKVIFPTNEKKAHKLKIQTLSLGIKLIYII